MDQKVIDEYYMQQAGNGLVAYAGPKYQKGNGFSFSRILQRLKPALKYIGRYGLRALTNIGQDILEGQNIGESSKKHIKDTTKRIMGDASEYLDNQKGTGNRKSIKVNKKLRLNKTETKQKRKGAIKNIQ